MIEEKKHPKCGRKEKVKNGFMNRFVRGKQGYKCKNCRCNYTDDNVDTRIVSNLQAIKYYLEGNGFRRIERLMHVSHVSFINWAKRLASKIKNIPRKNKKVDILEFDEMCISLKNITLDSSKQKN